MYKYERIIYWSEEYSAFLVEIPELPGCMADGATVAEAVANSDVVMKESLEVAQERGQEIPETLLINIYNPIIICYNRLSSGSRTPLSV